MKRKIIFLVLVGLILVTGMAFSWGIGAAFGIQPLGGLPSQQAMLSVEFPRLPILWGIGLELNSSQFNLGVTADWWLIDKPLVSFINIYLGPGLYLSLPGDVEFGARLPIGLNIFPVDFLELFLEVAPALAIISNNASITIPDFRLQGSFGLRFWFK